MTDRLSTELQRLYRLQNTAHTDTSHNPLVAAWVIELPQRLGWEKTIVVWQAIQQDCDFPAPAIAVNGTDAYQLWVSLERPVPWHNIQAWQNDLLQRHCTTNEIQQLRFWPLPHPVCATIPKRTPNGCWSAFIAPDLLSLFADEASLDIHPSTDAQADLLCRLRPIAWHDWQRATKESPAEAETAPATVPTITPTPVLPSSKPEDTPQQTHREAHEFLRQVMHNPEVDWQWRIEAAKALLHTTNQTQH